MRAPDGPPRGKAEGARQLPETPAPASLRNALTSAALTKPIPATESLQSTVLTQETLPTVWPQVIAQVGGMLATSLEAGFVAISGPNSLVIRFAEGYNHQREYCQDSSRLSRVEETLKKLTGQAWHFRVEQTDGDRTVAPSPTTETENSLTRYRRQRTEAAQVPLVKWAMEKLGAQIVQVDEGFGSGPTTNGERPETEAEPEEP